jgi:peptidoglycan/xylan/chitin deacetylase (PgdA/CDA1 family)
LGTAQYSLSESGDGEWYEYGFKEGIPRLLETYERRKVKVTSHMAGMAVEKHPALAKEIVERGHEPAAHGYTWEPVYVKTPAEERASYEANVRAIEKATGQKPIGFNAAGMRATQATFGILQDLASSTTPTICRAMSRS